MNLPGTKGFGSARAVKREMSIRSALEWAFGAEQVSVEFDEINDGPPATDTIWRLMRQGVLGCNINRFHRLGGKRGERSNGRLQN